MDKLVKMSEFVNLMWYCNHYECKNRKTILDLDKFSIFDYLAKNQTRKADKNNFQNNSFALFSEVDEKKEHEIRKSEPDYIIGRKYNNLTLYWYKDGGIYRLANLWGCDCDNKYFNIDHCDWYFKNDEDTILDMNQPYNNVCYGNVAITDRLYKRLKKSQFNKIPPYFENQSELDDYIRSSSFLPKNTFVEADEDPFDLEFIRWIVDIYDSSYIYKSNELLHLIEDEEAIGGRLGFVKFEDIMFKDALEDYIESFEDEDWYCDYLSDVWFDDYYGI